jgi:pimeloyl-ACP methyl ester carboxylesterase
MLNPQETLFVLVHDAWLGAWAWRDVSARLGERGWSAAALDLPGRTPDAAPDLATLQTYADAVVAVAQSWERGNVVLVGHGTAGPVVQLAAEQLGAKVAGIIFVSAFVLQNGETIASQMMPAMADFFKAVADADPAGRIDLSQLPDFWQSNILNDAPGRVPEVIAKIIPEPAAPFYEPVNLTSFFESRPPCAYVVFNEDLSQPPGELYPRQPNKLGTFRPIFISAGHLGILTHPREVAEAFVFLATQPRFGQKAEG